MMMLRLVYKYLCYEAIPARNGSAGYAREVVSEDSVAHGNVPLGAEKALQLCTRLCMCVCTLSI